ncbi:M3 family metallopeptidase [Luteococcus peritonei]|uniref:M3 family metallopeptidase n=1 Tax=Luteococcus peritonei TaxID=88874 RepID=A0ABW4RWE0_9ACTN
MSNPLLTPSDLPYGLPRFADITLAHYREAFEAGLAEHEAEVRRIVEQDEPASFENTVLALERSGRTLNRVAMIFFTKVASDSTEELRELEAELAPRMAAHRDAVDLDPQLFARVAEVHERVDELGLDPESVQLVERTWRGMQLAGAGLEEQAKQRLREINQELSTLTTRFQKNLLAETNDLAVLFATAEELDGLGEGQLSACRQAAAARGQEGYLVSLDLYTDHPYQAQLTNRDSRRRLHQASTSRGSRGNEHDNSDLVRRITALRAERAALLGCANHATVAVADQTARTPEEIERIVYPLAEPALANLRREAAALQQEVDTDCRERGIERFELAPWDWSHYAEKVRSRQYAVDTAALSPWFELDRVVREGVLWAATQLYGITFTPRPDIEAPHPDAQVFEVHDEDGTALGLFILDPFARESKRRGAWMNNLVEQSRLFDELPVVCNTLSIPRPAPGEPVLLTLDEVNTLFHEFGHALHGLLSKATYPSLAGTNVARDFVEFPSQVNEMWITWPEVVNHYARHHETGEPLPAEVLQRLEQSATFNQGFETVEYLASALLDQEWHKIAPGTEVTDVAAFEAEALERVGLANEWVAPRYRSTYFAHTFAGGYDAGYYSYIWSEILDADTVEWFRENGGLRRENGDHFRAELLSRGRTREPMDSFTAFRGREARIEPLLERRGLVAG